MWQIKNKSYLKLPAWIKRRVNKESYFEELLEEAMDISSTNAIKSLEIARDLLKSKPKDISIIVDAYTIVANYYINQDEFSEAEKYFLQAQKIVENDIIGIKQKGRFFLELGGFYNNFHKNDKALEALKQAKIFFRQVDDITSTLDLMLIEADLLQEMNLPKQAENNLKIIANIRSSSSHFKGLAMAYLKLGELLTYEFEDRTTEAEECFRQAVQQLSHDPTYSKVVYIGIIDFYRLLNRSQEALKYLNQAKKIKSIGNTADFKIFEFQIYIDTENYEKAENLFPQIEKQYLEAEHLSKLKYLYLAGFELFKVLEKVDEGRILFEKYSKIVDPQYQYQDLWFLYSVFGNFLLHFGYMTAAIQQYYQSVMALEHYRLSVPEEFDRITFFSDKVDQIYFFCKKATENKFFGKAFFFLESAKGKSLIDLLGTPKTTATLEYNQVKNLLK